MKARLEQSFYFGHFLLSVWAARLCVVLIVARVAVCPAALPFLSFLFLPKRSFTGNMRGLVNSVLKCVVLGLAACFFDDVPLALGLNLFSATLVTAAAWAGVRAWGQRSSAARVRPLKTISVGPAGSMAGSTRAALATGWTRVTSRSLGSTAVAVEAKDQAGEVKPVDLSSFTVPQSGGAGVKSAGAPEVTAAVRALGPTGRVSLPPLVYPSARVSSAGLASALASGGRQEDSRPSAGAVPPCEGKVEMSAAPGDN